MNRLKQIKRFKKDEDEKIINAFLRSVDGEIKCYDPIIVEYNITKPLSEIEDSINKLHNNSNLCLGYQNPIEPLWFMNITEKDCCEYCVCSANIIIINYDCILLKDAFSPNNDYESMVKIDSNLDIYLSEWFKDDSDDDEVRPDFELWHSLRNNKYNQDKYNTMIIKDIIPSMPRPRDLYVGGYMPYCDIKQVFNFNELKNCLKNYCVSNDNNWVPQSEDQNSYYVNIAQKLQSDEYNRETKILTAKEHNKGRKAIAAEIKKSGEIIANSNIVLGSKMTDAIKQSKISYTKIY